MVTDPHAHAIALCEADTLDCRAGRLAAGLNQLREAARLAPGLAEVHYNLGVALAADRRPLEAAASYRKAVAAKPRFSQAIYNLAAALLDAGQFEAAVDALHQAIQLRPDDADVFCNLGVALSQLGRLPEAADAYRRAVTLRPNRAETHYNFGLTLAKMPGHSRSATAAFRRAAELRPGFVFAWVRLAESSLAGGEIERAIDAASRAVRLDPRLAEAHALYAAGLQQAGDTKAAVAAYRRSVELRPDDVATTHALAALLTARNRPAEAAEAYERLLEHHPDHAATLNNLAIAYKSIGRVDQCVATYRRLLKLHPGYVDAHSNLLMALHYDPASTPQSLRAEHRRWDEQHARPLWRHALGHTNTRDPLKRLKIGYVSGDFWDHAAARFLLPLLRHHDRRHFRIYCYANSTKRDAVTDQLRRQSDDWRCVAGVDDNVLAEWIRADGIDVLVDCSMHTQGNRLTAFARQPAPVQATWLGYAGTTGLSSVGWRITDAQLDPVDDRDAYAERSVRLAGCFWCYDPIHPTAAVSPLPALETGQVTFGCFNNFAKVSAPTQELWADVMAGVADSRLVLHCPPGSQRAELLKRFAARGVGESRIDFVGRLPLLDYMARYRLVDIALDPFPFNGGTTTCDALWMGVPTISLRGTTAVGRAGASILTAAGLGDWVADAPADYVRIAQDRAADLPGLAVLRGSLRERVRQSTLMDAADFAAAMEAAFRHMWTDWCGEG